MLRGSYEVRRVHRDEDRLGAGTLMTRVRTLLTHYHHAPARLRDDPELRQALLPLYGKEGERIWREHVRPFLAERDLALRTIYAEHAIDDDFTLLDTPEALLVLERLEHDRARLRQVWPLDRSDLERLRDVWGVPV